MKAVFFDFDGTLCAPNFFVDGNYQIGMPWERWNQFIAEKKDDIFVDCKPVACIKQYAICCKEEGAILYVLTRTGGEIEDQAKKVFMGKWYPGLFDEYISVRHDADKIVQIQEVAKKLQIALTDCELVEDTYSILLEAIASGIGAKHVSNLYVE